MPELRYVEGLGRLPRRHVREILVRLRTRSTSGVNAAASARLWDYRRLAVGDGDGKGFGVFVAVATGRGAVAVAAIVAVGGKVVRTAVTVVTALESGAEVTTGLVTARVDADGVAVA